MFMIVCRWLSKSPYLLNAWLLQAKAVSCKLGVACKQLAQQAAYMHRKLHFFSVFLSIDLLPLVVARAGYVGGGYAEDLNVLADRHLALHRQATRLWAESKRHLEAARTTERLE
jgi:hypothetical protein